MVEVWRRHSNYLVVVAAPDEDALLTLSNKASAAQIAVLVVREPDDGNRVTAVALEPGETARKMCSQLPLALKGVMATQHQETVMVP